MGGGGDVVSHEDIAFALGVVLLGLLMMITRYNAVTQVIGFMSLENGLILAATGARGMPLVVEISVAFSVLIAFIVFGVFVFRIRERFDTVDVTVLERFRGARQERQRERNQKENVEVVDDEEIAAPAAIVRDGRDRASGLLPPLPPASIPRAISATGWRRDASRPCCRCCCC